VPQGFGQVFVARREQTIAVRIMAAVLCLSLIGWSMLPSLSHVPRIAETRHEHAQMIADHGHSHDAVDHDHSLALAVAATSGAFWPAGQDGLRLWASQSGPHRIFRIERPPRG
jgi:hypothetical protein